MNDKPDTQTPGAPADLLASLPEENPNPVLIANPDGSVLYANPAGSDVVGLLTPDGMHFQLEAMKKAVIRVGASREPAEFNITIGERVFSFELSPARQGRHVCVYGRDITSRVENERSLRESQARFEAIAQNSPAILCLKDMEGRYIFANQKFQEVHGLELDQILGKTVHDLFEPEIAEPLFEHDMLIAEQGVPEAREQLIAAHDGLRNFMEVKFPITLPPDGSVAIGLIGTDITDRKRESNELQAAREAVEAADALLLDALENMSDGIVIYDADNRLVLCNRRFKEFYQYTEEEASPGTLFEDLIKYDLQKGLIADQTDDGHFTRRVGQREVEGGSLEIQLTDGRWLQIRDRRTSGGGTVSIQTDISKQKEAEATLQTVIDTTPAIINVKDREGHFLLCNPAQAEFYGLTASELRGKKVSEVADADYARQTMDRDRQVLEQGAALLGFEDTSLDKHGKSSTWYTTKVPLKGLDGSTRGILTIAHDITNRKDEEIALIAAKEVAEAEVSRQREAIAQAEKMSALGSLLANVSHELNNPLSVVIGQADILQELVKDEDVLNRIGRIKSAADRSARIVRTFLATVRQQPPERSSFSAVVPVEEALKTAEYGLVTSGIEFTQQAETNLASVYGDSGQISQVLANLLINAQQALSERPQPRVIKLSVGKSGDGSTIIYRVRDNGPGIAEEHRGRIFDPFFTTKSEGSGTGIGLSIAHNIVTAHGGTLTLVQNEYTAGACFEMHLPVHVAEDGEETAEEAPEEPAEEITKRPRVLVVDDEPDVGETVADHLTLLGYSCELAGNGQHALEFLESLEFAFVLSDIRMPVLDGPGLYLEAAKRWPGIEKKFGFITGDTLSPAASKFLKETGAETIDKPFTRADLEGLLQRVLQD